MASLFPPPYQPLPYCGSPPTPENLLFRWNLDPILIGVLALVLVVYGAGLRRTLRRGRRLAGSPYCFLAGWAIATFALISPLCPLSVSLFAARVGQHMVLTTLAAPLLALGLSERRFGPAAGSFKFERLASPALGASWASAAAFAAALWFWHAPGPYAATFHSDWIYWAMHATTLGAAIWLWLSVLSSRTDFIGCFLTLLLTTGQMGLLGAVITFAGRPLYAPHLATSLVWGLTPLEDQQLGGVVMWIPAGLIFTLGFVFAFMALMRRAETAAFSRVRS